MGLPAVITIALYSMMPIFGPSGIFFLSGFLVLPYIVSRWAYERFEGAWWILAAAGTPLVWLGLMFLLFSFGLMGSE